MTTQLAGVPFHFDKTDLVIVLLVVAVMAVRGLWGRALVKRAESWPVATAKIENVFIDTETRGTKIRSEVTYAALAYSYSVAGAFYSGEIKLLADGSKLEQLESEMIGRSVAVHFNPRNPSHSMFVGNEVRGWAVRRN